MNAIYIDFECLKKPATPILLGILKDLRGEQHFEQLILDESLKKIPGRDRLRHASVQEAAASLVAEADASDCPIVGWSLFDRNVLLDCDIPESVKAGIMRRYANALDIAKPWKARMYPAFKIVKAGKFEPAGQIRRACRLSRCGHASWRHAHQMDSGSSESAGSRYVSRDKEDRQGQMVRSPRLQRARLPSDAVRDVEGDVRAREVA
jgi:hypothetical protein